MRLKIRNAFFLTVLSLLLFSCASRKKMVYLQDIDNVKSYDAALNYEPKLQPDDLLGIAVFAENPELTIPFNLPQIQTNYDIGSKQDGSKVYLIDNEGYIDFPVIGKMKLGGLSKSEANKFILEKVAEYIKNPSINLRILNYKITILGEVLKPGTYTFPSERITILDALGMAGDLTIYGKRNNILVIREAEGKKTYNRIDITNAGFLNSQAYYLAQNDVVVVEPNQTKINGAAVGSNTAAILSGISLLVSISVLLFK